MDIINQISYWKKTAESNLEVVDILFDKKKNHECLFFCHLVIEKILKAHWVKKFETIPPKSHNLLYLIDKIEITINEYDYEFVGILMKFQLEGRYPEYLPTLPKSEEIKKIINQMKELYQCLIKIL